MQGMHDFHIKVPVSVYYQQDSWAIKVVFRYPKTRYPCRVFAVFECNIDLENANNWHNCVTCTLYQVGVMISDISFTVYPLLIFITVSQSTGQGTHVYLSNTTRCNFTDTFNRLGWWWGRSHTTSNAETMTYESHLRYC